ncbi:phage holin family protein [Sphingomonas sp. NSE70-1]|uniref:Phage holin family protein n=1 Tax=Sphingomonas caseinilyticus TaxID=2908205 RepID=A0ABT0RRB9_9SPHN|nr:phage holin family protein [Sphingomonas caseinilyticus]MCL6697558.1 phage holin family protein [Sphingomonas caseinilyticus]
MANGGDDDLQERPIGELFGQLIDEGKAYAKAELGLAKATAEAKADAAKKPALLAGAALLFLIAGVVVLCMTLALALATLVGPLAGGLIAALVTFGIAGWLGLWAKKELGKLK